MQGPPLESQQGLPFLPMWVHLAGVWGLLAGLHIAELAGGGGGLLLGLGGGKALGEFKGGLGLGE